MSAKNAKTEDQESLEWEMAAFPLAENTHLYQLHEMHHAAMAPIGMLASAGKHLYHNPLNPLSYTTIGRTIAAASELVERITRRYGKPEFGINETEVNGKAVAVEEELVHGLPFCNLLHFKRNIKNDDPRLLIVAPMSGHHATLLRGTVRDMLPHADVYITDWIDARDIPQYEGKFDLDDYIYYVMQFIKKLGPNTHVMAVCQPAVPVFAAVALMNSTRSKCTPPSMTLIGGPIDTRINSTEVNNLAETRPLSWFEQNVITRVPVNYPGFMRRVYPGFLQLTGFMTMNLDRHIGAHLKLFQHLVEGDGESVETHKAFYNEYLSVMDITAEFYLQTVETVFQKHLLPRGEMLWNGEEHVDPAAITKTALLTIEGERDDISGVGQTEAAHNLCTNLPPAMRKHHLQKGVGHYGLFNGRRYRQHIVPVINEFIRKHDG